MKLSDFIIDFLAIFIATFIVSSLVTYIYNLLVHSAGSFDWATTFRLSIILGIILPWIHLREKKK